MFLEGALAGIPDGESSQTRDQKDDGPANNVEITPSADAFGTRRSTRGAYMSGDTIDPPGSRVGLS